MDKTKLPPGFHEGYLITFISVDSEGNHETSLLDPEAWDVDIHKDPNYIVATSTESGDEEYGEATHVVYFIRSSIQNIVAVR